MTFSTPAANGDPFERVEVKSTQSIVEVLKTALSGNGVERVFGEPVTEGGRTIIPIADIGSTFGFGSGSGSGSGTGEDDTAGSGEGGGAGGKLSGRPIGFLEISDEGTSFIPTVDRTKVTTWSILAGAFLLWMIIRKL